MNCNGTSLQMIIGTSKSKIRDQRTKSGETRESKNVFKQGLSSIDILVDI